MSGGKLGKRLADKVVIITGGGSGIGKATASLFAKEGARVVVAQRTIHTGEETVSTIKSDGGEAVFIRTDVTIAAEVEHLIRETTNRFGKIDILFNNAGMVHSRTPVENIDENLWDRVYTINVKGYFLPIKYAVPEMKKAGDGAIVNISSTLAVKPQENFSCYASSKGAVITLTKALAVELAPHKIRVNCICPMAVDTRMQRQLVAKDIGNWDTFEKEVAKRTPLGRMATPDEVACAALYLASDEASMVTGTCINIDGGSAI